MNTYLARVACVGQWTLNNLKLKDKIVHNQQKTRVDLFLDVESGKINRTKSDIALKHIIRSDLTNSIKSQESMFWLNDHTPVAIIMDSFSELTDQRFDHKSENWSFCSNYSDIVRTAQFNSLFYNRWLLDENVLYNKYCEFFQMVRRRYDCPIVFIHVPVALDVRKICHRRYNVILDSISQISNIYDIFVVEADEDAIVPRKNAHEAVAGSPFHFADSTIKHLSDKIKMYGKVK